MQRTRRARRVLVVEDNRDAREGVRLMLELAGHEVIEAEDGLGGLELLLSAQPDVALIDVGLPGLDGYQIAMRYRAAARAGHVTLVALTGYGTAEARERSRRAGFDHHLIKPVSSEHLCALIDGGNEPRASTA